MSPEILSNQRYYDELCDIYSFGIIMYEVLFEIRPYSSFEDTGDKNEPISLFHLGIEVMNGKRPEIPNIQLSNTEQEYISLMKKCWNHNPSIRPSFLEIHKEMEAFLTEEVLSPQKY